MPLVGFEPAIPAVKRLQTYAIDLVLYVHNLLCDECLIILFTKIIFSLSIMKYIAGPSGRAVEGVSLRPLACWNCGFEFRRGTWMFVCCECCVLSGRGLCDELITRPEECYRLWCVAVCDLEIPGMGRPCPALGRSATGGRRRKVYCNFTSREGQILLHNFSD